MNKYYARKKCNEIDTKMNELEKRLKTIEKYCKDENEYYSTPEYKEWEKLQAKYDYYYCYSK